ncbi:Peptidase S28 [Metarhizium robertsii ARSEF 23]|nr:Peptidase S28 [Metarhizium robertsii ARSEF 23]KHO11494.1 Peptidase S28 [Metarhizium robertsii ARSEF 23]
MITYGVSYGYVAAGKFYVFLYYDPTEPRTLYHHLCVPERVVRDAANEDDWSTHMSNTAVAQLASFCLQSLQSEAAEGPDLEASTQAAKESLAIWGRQGYVSEDSETNTCVRRAYNKPAKQYCTQACLLGLKTGRHLANNCPNVQFHRAVGGNEQHAIDMAEFTRLVNEQLRRDPYDYCELLSPWGMYGSTGVLFKLELAPYGYTFVAKGTTATLLCSLEHETNVYEKLHRLQGDAVPVHLGLVELPGGYILPGGLRAVHMMLMSWGGQTVKEGKSPGLSLEVQRSSEAVRNEGIYHDDVHDANLLWNEELGRVMVIDFDYAKILEPPKHKTVVDLSKKERKRGQKRVVANCPGKAKVLDSHPEAL